MLPVIIFILAGCAVRCDNFSNNNYVIEIPEDASRDTFRKPFDVYWNVPTMQCTSKKIPFENLYEKFGIIQNAHDHFAGDKMVILYDPGLFPALLKNKTSGKLLFRNGGVPQEGNLDEHIEIYKINLTNRIPDPNFNGIAVIDFESWRPVFRQNFGDLVPYKDISFEIERRKHWWWWEDRVKAEATSRYEHSARVFMETTLQVSKQLRPRATWGYYGFPYCFNGADSVGQCSSTTRLENDRTNWLWSESSALFPSVYSSSSLSTSQLETFIRLRVAEAARVIKKNTPILPYFWYRYRDGGFLSERDLKAALQTFYKSKASGIVIWGSSDDVKTVDKCNKLLDYINDVMGPAIAKYTKLNPKVDDYPIDKLDLQSDEAYVTTSQPYFLDNNTTLQPEPENSNKDNLNNTTDSPVTLAPGNIEVETETSTYNIKTRSPILDLLINNNAGEVFTMEENCTTTDSYDTSTIDLEQYTTQHPEHYETTINNDAENYFFNVDTFLDSDENYTSTVETIMGTTTDTYTTESETTTDTNAIMFKTVNELDNLKDFKKIVLANQKYILLFRILVDKDADDMENALKSKKEDGITETAEISKVHKNVVKDDNSENETIRQ